MKKTIAVRNLRLCTKDCLCLYVCPTGASDTENSVIDTAKCVGCGTCAAACPSGAISMVPVEYPPQQKKAGAVLAPAYALANAKARQEQAARQLAALNDQLAAQAQIVAAAQTSDDKIVSLYGEASAEALNYQKTLLEEMTAYQDLQKEIDAIATEIGELNK